MSNPITKIDFVQQSVQFAVKNGLDLLGLHQYMEGIYDKQYLVKRARLAEERPYLTASEPVIKVGKEAHVLNNPDAEVPLSHDSQASQLTIACRRSGVMPAVKQAMWIEAITYMVTEGIQLKRGEMFSYLEQAEKVDFEASDKLARDARSNPVVDNDLPF